MSTAKYRAENRERIREQSRQYKAENRERIRERDRQYRAENRERINEQKRQYRAENRERINEQERRYEGHDPEYYRRNKKYFSERAYRRWKELKNIPAPNNGEPWLLAEDWIIRRSEISLVEMCYILGRSYDSVSRRRQEIGAPPTRDVVK